MTKIQESDAVQKVKAQVPIYIYLHTHWDREWYLPFNTARALLVDRARKTLTAIESGELPSFYLDGQAVVLEDLVEIEPGLGDRIKNAMRKGHLSAGPWYVLPDQSLVGGESLVRNLLLGIKITRRFGQPTMTGYNPDTFCHVQDLPRILNGFNISTTLVLRGVPPLEGSNVFWWQSPDGSRVLTYWLNKGLSHPVFHKTTDAQEIADDLASRWDLSTIYDTSAPMLYSAGGEFMQPPGQIQSKLEAVNSQLPNGCLAKTVSMDEFLVDLESWAKNRSLPEVTGDLRDNRSVSEKFPAYVLDGVSSTRLYLKRDNALAEHRLIRVAEPLFALLHATGIMPYPEHEFTYIWKLLLQNHPHDSICGCSVDTVHQEMRTRTQQLNSYLDGLDFIAMEKLGESQARLQESKPAMHSALPAVAGPQPNDPDNAYNRLAIYNTSCYAQQAPIPMTWYAHPESISSESSNLLQIESDTLVPNHLFQSGAGFYYKPVRHIQGWVWPVQPVPAMGLSEQAWTASASSSTSTIAKAKTQQQDSCATAQLLKLQNTLAITNGLIQARFDQKGNLIVDNYANGQNEEIHLGHHFYDVGDGGDTYNFDPLLNDVPIKSELIDIKPGKSGPLISSLVLTYTIDIPCGLDNEAIHPDNFDKGRSKKIVRHTLKTEMTLKKGVPILFFQTVLENFASDHRLSVQFTTKQKIKESWSECHFSLAKRLPISDSPQLPVPVGHEILPTSNFCQRFFIALGQAFFNSGLPEYRMQDNSVEITLLRAVSYLSRGRLRTRGGGAGPWNATPEANCMGINRCDYAWAPLGGTPIDTPTEDQLIRAYQLADLFEGRLVAFPIGKFKEAQAQSYFAISNPTCYVTAAYVQEEQLHIRLLNITTSPQTTSVNISAPLKTIGKVNLLGEDFYALSSTSTPSGATIVDLEFKPNALITLAVELAGKKE